MVSFIAALTLGGKWKIHDIDSIKRDLELKVDKKEVAADRNLITYKLDVITAEIEEMKVSLKEIKGEIHGLRK